MSTQTTNLNLTIPEIGDDVKTSIGAMAQNFERLDTPGLQVVTGSYAGDDASSRTIKLPIAPKMLMLFGNVFSATGFAFYAEGICYYAYSSEKRDGSGVCPVLSGNTLTIVNRDFFNYKDYTMQYIAIG